MNFDGLVTYTSTRREVGGYSYAQVFRNGCIEVVDSDMLGYHEEKIIPGGAFEKYILESLGNYISGLNKHGIAPPLLLMLSLLNVKDYEMAVSATFSSHDRMHPIDRQNLIVPEVILEDFSNDPSDIMKPAFDVVWNACGWAGSRNYDTKTGKWVGG